MPAFQPEDPNFEARVTSSFYQQTFMKTIGATLTHVAPGEVEIELPVQDSLTQQHGYTHAGAVTAIADSACGYAALSLLPAGAEVLTVEYKVNFLAPASGTRLVARGRVIRSGQTLSVCASDVTAVGGPNDIHVAVMLATIVRSGKRVRMS